MSTSLPDWLWPRSGRLGLAEWLFLLLLLSLLLSGVLWVSQPAKIVIQAQDQQRRADLIAIQDALQKYAEDHDGQYPVVSSAAGYYSCYNCGWPEAQVEAVGGQSYNQNNWIPSLVEEGYMSGLPIDPWQGAAPGCETSGYIYLSGGVGYKVFDWCGPRTGLVDTSDEMAYCSRPPYDGSKLNTQPVGIEPLPELVDPARPSWGYAIYTFELACY